jgi:hypothetical protein
MVSQQNVRTALDKFEKLEFLTNTSTKTGRLISICNWDRYQENEVITNKPPNKDITDDQQTPNKGLTPNKKEIKKKVKKVKTQEEIRIFNGLKSVFIENYVKL